MKSRLLFGIFGVLLLALAACGSKQMDKPSEPAPAPQAAPAPAPAPAPEPAKPVEAPATAPAPEAPASADKVEREKKLAEVTTGQEPVPTESKFEGKEGSFVAGVECGVKDDLGTVSVTLTNPTEGTLKLGDRPQVFEGGGEMVGLTLNGRYVLDYLECKDYDAESGLKPGDKVTCWATVPADSNKEKVLVRHAPNALGNPVFNILNVYSPGGGREQVQFEC